jgi:hypothetical protein
MNEGVVSKIIIIILIVLIAAVSVLWSRLDGLSAKVGSNSSAIEKIKESRGGSRLISDSVCTLERRKNWCETDFLRLSTNPYSAKGKHLRITGFLAVDNGIVALFASEEDYKSMERGRSIEVRGSREELVKLFSEFGYKKVRLEGTFGIDLHTRRGGWLGVLLPPHAGTEVHPREAREGVEDIAVDVGFIEADP